MGVFTLEFECAADCTCTDIALGFSGLLLKNLRTLRGCSLRSARDGVLEFVP